MINYAEFFEIAKRLAKENPCGHFCPFCMTGEFDLVGLKMHLSYGWCEAYRNTGNPCTDSECPYHGQQKPQSCECINDKPRTT